MLKVPQLDELTYDQMVRRAVSRIPAMTEEWTDYNAHDPGITVLQTYAWLVDMLNYYMNATGDAHILKYLKLLGIRPEPARAAGGFVVLKADEEQVQIPEGTQLFAGEIPFEVPRDVQVRPNRLLFYINEVDGQGMDLTAFTEDGEYAPAFAEHFQEQAILYWGFERPLGTEAELYVCVEETGERVPFEDRFSLCDLRWQYYTAAGWKDVCSVQDDTCGFLRSERICLELSEPMELFAHPDGPGAAYTIRCMAKENTYDVLPRIGSVYTGLLPVRQVQCLQKPGERILLGRTDGCANQELPFQMRGVCGMELELESAREGEESQTWNRVEDLNQAGYQDRVFCFSEQEQCIRFGDGIHGVQPSVGQKVFLKNLTCSLYGKGNVRKGELCAFARPELYPWKVENPRAIVDGRDGESVQELLERMEDTLFTQQRMVTREDYEKAVQETPGLKIDKVHVIAGSVYGEIYGRERDYNEIVLVVKPVSGAVRPELSEAYRQRIADYLEPLRLLNTKVSIVSPVYVGITVHGKIALQNQSPEEIEQVRQVLREQLDYSCQEKPFGCRIQLDRLYNLLEAREGVLQVYSLSLEQEGRGARRQENGNLYLNEDALSYLKDVDLEFCERK